MPLSGCDCYAYGLLAAGYADLVVEADLKPYDYMALVPVIQVGVPFFHPVRKWTVSCRRPSRLTFGACPAPCDVWRRVRAAW